MILSVALIKSIKYGFSYSSYQYYVASTTTFSWLQLYNVNLTVQKMPKKLSKFEIFMLESEQDFEDSKTPLKLLIASNPFASPTWKILEHSLKVNQTLRSQLFRLEKALEEITPKFANFWKKTYLKIFSAKTCQNRARQAKSARKVLQ